MRKEKNSFVKATCTAGVQISNKEVAVKPKFAIRRDTSRNGISFCPISVCGIGCRPNNAELNKKSNFVVKHTISLYTTCKIL